MILKEGTDRRDDEKGGGKKQEETTKNWLDDEERPTQHNPIVEKDTQWRDYNID